MSVKMEKSFLRDIIGIYCVLMIFRLIEYFYIRTDETFFGESFLHKLVGILLVGIVLHSLKWKWNKVGFGTFGVLKKVLGGIFLGIFVYSVAYGAEWYFLFSQGEEPLLEWYAVAYSLTDSPVRQIGPLFFLLCIFMNVINVIMEEGCFRGVFLKLGEMKFSSFWKANFLSGALFGLWHFVMAWRGYIDGGLELNQAIILGGIAVGSSFLMGLKWGMLANITGSLWAGMADHFVNNTIINLLHVETSGGSDEFLMLRISIAQTLSFVIILIFYLKKSKKKSLFKN